MESTSGESVHATPPAYEVAIWCTVRGDSEEEVRDTVYDYCQRLKDFLGRRLVVKAIEVGSQVLP